MWQAASRAALRYEGEGDEWQAASLPPSRGKVGMGVLPPNGVNVQPRIFFSSSVVER